MTMWCSAVGGIVTLILGLLATPCAVEAQQAKSVPRIGFLTAASPAGIAARTEAFRQGLRELGYVEGQNIVVEYRWAEGSLDRLPELAAELVRLQVALIVSAGPAVHPAAKTATVTIPIVMAWDGDPVGNGFVASLARPGGNMTGLSILAPEISGKQLELLKDIVPTLSRVAVFGTSNEPGTAQALRETQRAAGTFGIQLQYLDVLEPKDIETAFRAATQGGADAVLALSSLVLFSHRTQVADLAVKSRLPAIYAQSEQAKDGGLISYGISYAGLYRRAATYVDKILKGAKPADLPVEQPTKFELVLNLKTAKALGITMPPSLLLLADEVIQ
jgi:putative ABC transport system substrate-binding protein